MRSSLHFLFYFTAISILLIAGAGCANIIPPSGGPRDSIPPLLISATPPDSAKNIRPSKVTLTFNEYLMPLQNVENVIISPTLPNVPAIESRLRTITVRFRDTLEPNTTYSINFGNVIRDVNEGNPIESFTYVFSTGNKIDENSFGGKVILAETGKIDSTLIVVLHRNLADSAVQKFRPLYYTKIDGSGNFTFNNLPEGKFAVYALPNDFMKRYDDSIKRFAFLDSPIVVGANTPAVTLYAYEQEKRRAITSSGSGNAGNKAQDKRLRYTNPEGSVKDVFSPLTLDFVRKLKTLDSTKIILSDTNYNRINNYSVRIDSPATRLVLNHQWQLNTKYKLIIQKDAVADAEGITLSKNDTLTFTTRRAEDYGHVRIRFTNIDLAKNPVLQLVQGDVIVESVPLTSREWKRDLFKPGDYDLRILYDANKNGVWDPGNFKKKRQPEIVQSISRKLSVRASWENEVEITL
jgi:hypothetical protein